MHKQKSSRQMINYTSYHGKFKYAKLFVKFSKTKFEFKESWNVQNLFKASLQKKLCKHVNYYSKLSKELKKVEIQWLEVGLNIDLVG